MLACKRSLRFFQERQQQSILAFTQRDRCFIGVYESSAETLETPAIKPIAASLPLANLRCTRQLPASQYGAGACEQFPGARPYNVVVGAEFEADDWINFVGVVAGHDDWNI